MTLERMLLAGACTFALGFGAACTTTAEGEPDPGLETINHEQGSLWTEAVLDSAKVKISWRGVEGKEEGTNGAEKPVTAGVGDFVYTPGLTDGWHYHDGPFVVLVNSGTLTEYRYESPGCRSARYFSAGQAFFEPPGQRHLVINDGDEDVYLTFAAFAGQGESWQVQVDAPSGACVPNP